MKEVYILQIETATPDCSVAVSKNGLCVAEVSGMVANVHASHLTVFIEEVLAKAGIAYAMLSAVAVSMGPGSYTGLRIGVSAAKGLCYALDIPLIAVNTLDAMLAGFMTQSYDVVTADAKLLPMIDARRMEVYTAVYDAKGQLVEPTAAKIIDETSFGATGAVVLFGSGADKFIPIFQGQEHILIVPEFHNEAAHFSSKAYQKFVDGQVEDLIYFEPFYLKDFMVSTPKKR